MSGFTDIHAHFLYGMDDGAKTRKQMEDMLDAAHADGISSIFATPHATPGVEPFDQTVYAERLTQAQTYCRRSGYALNVFSGAEILYTPMLAPFAEQRRLPTLAGSEFALVEFVPDISFEELADAVDLLTHTGYTPVLAHIERYGCMGRSNAYRLKEQYDVRYQMNCGAILGRRGFLLERRIQKWLKDEIIDFVATDTHNCHERPSRMRETYAVLARQYGEAYAKKLTGLE